MSGRKNIGFKNCACCGGIYRKTRFMNNLPIDYQFPGASVYLMIGIQLLVTAGQIGPQGVRADKTPKTKAE